MMGVFGASPESGGAPLTVNFSYIADQNGTYTVEFGDGATGSPVFTTNCNIEDCIPEYVISHTYTSSGTYTSKLKDGSGTVLKTATITVTSTQSLSLADLQARLEALMQEIAQLQATLNSSGPACASQYYYTPDPNSTDPCAIYSPTATPVTPMIGTATNPAALIITSIDNPGFLAVGQSGTWTVHASSTAAANQLQYSAVWGDTASSPAQSSATFAHTYANAATYYPQFTVTDTSSNSASASTSVAVSDNESSGGNGISCLVLTQTLSFGQMDATTNGQVTLLQQFLVNYFNLADGTAAGYFGVGNVGSFGNKTQALVKRFQTQKGISPVGFVGPQTRAAIANVCAPPPSPPQSTFTASPTSGPAPLTVNFFAPDNFDYRINFGDGSAPDQYWGPNTQASCRLVVGHIGCVSASHTYPSAGTYTAKLTKPTSSVTCNNITYDPNNPISFLDLGASNCTHSPSTTVIGTMLISVTGSETNAVSPDPSTPQGSLYAASNGPDYVTSAPSLQDGVLTVGRYAYFRATITNQSVWGGSPGTMSNTFQMYEGGAMVSQNTISSGSAINANGGSIVVDSTPYQFQQPGTYYVRACANLYESGSVWSNSVAESNYDNNCGPWTAFTVGGISN